MVKPSYFALFALAFQPLPVLAQTQTQYGFPVTEIAPGNLPCHMVTDGGNTLDLAKLCGGQPQIVVSSSKKQSVTQASKRDAIPRKRLSSSQYKLQYKRLAETYPDSRVREMLAPDISYAESVCERLESGITLEEIRSEDIGKLTPSSNLTLDNKRKQNIEITLKLAPQYYCPAATD